MLFCIAQGNVHYYDFVVSVTNYFTITFQFYAILAVTLVFFFFGYPRIQAWAELGLILWMFVSQIKRWIFLLAAQGEQFYKAMLYKEHVDGKW